MSYELAQDFSNYQLDALPDNGVFGLADHVLPEMMAATGYTEFDAEHPTEEAIKGFIGHMAPERELQKNIMHTKSLIAQGGADPEATAAEWVTRSKVLEPLSRNFVTGKSVPEYVAHGIISGGTANWMLRRANVAVDYVTKDEQGQKRRSPAVSLLHLVAGDREMNPGEHLEVKRFVETYGRKPLESEFMTMVVRPILRSAGLEADLYPIEGKEGRLATNDDVLGFAADILQVPNEGIVFGNAPNGIQNAGQLYNTMRSPNLYVVTDGFPLAEEGEPAAMAQNRYSALGQIARNALVLHQISQRA